MNRYIYLSLFLSLVAIASLAAPVDQQDAAKAAGSFLRSTPSLEQSSLKGLNPGILTGSEEIPLIYVFDLVPKGFILLSADDRSYPILAFSTESNYDATHLPDNFAAWLEGYKNQILSAINNNVPPDEKSVKAWQYLSDDNPDNDSPSSTLAVAPLLTCTWNQGAPYNYLCPADPGGSGGHVYAGCVATAMSQVAYYWRWPLQGTGSHGYYSDYGYLFADYAATTYNWNAMGNAAIGRNFEMANIQYHMGIGVDMMYGPDGSGAYSTDAAQALIDYFGMDAGLHLEYAPSPIDESWKSLIRNELDNGRPLYYHGFGSGGHAFNLDGYEGTEYFHFNWGWGGSFNGYFYLNNLNPGGNTFTEGQGAIVGIQPTGNYPYYCNSTVTLTDIYGTIEDGSGPVSPYQVNSNCGWLIMPDDSIVNIQLTFHRFDLEDNGDFLTIYDGADTTAPVLGVYTGSDSPQQVISSTGMMFIKFTSNGSGNQGGWFASYQANRAVFCSGLTVLTAPEGSIDDGSGTFEYHENSLCKYKIMPDSAQSITLTFNYLDTYDEEDFLLIFNLENNELLYTLFGQQNPGTLYFNTSKLLVMFHSDNGGNAQGWSFNYSSSPFTGVAEFATESLLRVYPNPADEVLHYSVNLPQNSTGVCELISLRGEKVFSSPLQGKVDATIDVSGFSEGMYFFRIVSGENSITRKIMIQ